MKKQIIMLSVLLSAVVLMACSVFGIADRVLPSSNLTATQPVKVITSPPQVIVVTATSQPAQPVTENQTQATKEVDESSSLSLSKKLQGILLADETQNTLKVHNTSGELLGEITLPGLFFNSPEFIHAYGMQNGELASLTILYYQNDPPILRKYIQGQTEDLFPMQYMVGMRGVPGQSGFLMGTGIIEGNGLSTELLGVSFDPDPQIQSYITSHSNDSRVYSPLQMMKTETSAVSGWFSMEAWGIGGAFFYPQRYGLYAIDSTSGNIHWLFNNNYRPSSISADGKYAAVIELGSTKAGALKVFDLATLSPILEFPLLMGQDLGAGFAVFSPDHQKIAWVEAGGEIMAMQPTFHSLLRYADMHPDAVPESIPAVDLAVSDVPDANATIKPLVWLDQQYLLVEASTIQAPKPILWLVDTQNNTYSQFATGKFMGLIY